MEKEARKATDVLLDLESRIETLLQIVRSQDLNIKLLSNKLNMVMEKLDKQPAATSKIVVEAVNSIPQNSVPAPNNSPVQETDKNIPISSDFNVPTENSPQGFRRTSRPETFAGDNSYLKSPAEPINKFPLQIPKPTNRTVVDKAPELSDNDAEVVVDPSAFEQRLPTEPKKEKVRNSNSIPVVQRVVNKEGKSVFLAEIEILDLANQEIVGKTRTNGTGKWMASLPVGSYRVMLKKRESLSKEKIEIGQTIHVDGTQSPLELQTMIIK